MSKRSRFLRVVAPLALVCAPLVVALAPAGATTSVSNEAQLHTAFVNGSESSISITADITLSNCGSPLVRSSTTALTITGNGHTVHQTCSSNTFQQNLSGALSFDGVSITMSPGQDAIDAGTGSNVTFTSGSITNIGDGTGIDASNNVTVSSSTIGPVADGDGISNGGNVTLTTTAITGVTTGDGVSNGGNVTLTDSAISGGQGSCDDISNGGNVTLTRSTLIGCDDSISNGGAVTLVNSTIANSSREAISTGGSVTLTFSTMVGSPTAVDTGGTLTATGSVISGNGGDVNCTVGSTSSHGYNFVNDGTCGFNNSTDIKTGSAGLGSLGNNGGFAETAVPQTGSQLIDKVPSAACTVSTDERGVTRPQGTACDIGAVEVAVNSGGGGSGGGTAPPAAPVSANPSLTG
jgi:hypothetical protein